MSLNMSVSLILYGTLLLITSNSTGVTHWKLSKDRSKVVPNSHFPEQLHTVADCSLHHVTPPPTDPHNRSSQSDNPDNKDDLMSILVRRYNGPTLENQLPNMDNNKSDDNNNNKNQFQTDTPIDSSRIDTYVNNNTKNNSIKYNNTNNKHNKTNTNQNNNNINIEDLHHISPTLNQQKKVTSSSEVGLSCGKPAKETIYDHLEGVARRRELPHNPEPEVLMIFKNVNSKLSEEETLKQVEQTLKNNIKRKPIQTKLFNQIGNYWRIRGNTYLAIECFRKALSLKPDNPDVLLNLARVLYNLDYLQDSVYLARISLQNQNLERNSWLQHYTLGEVLEASGDLQEAVYHYYQAQILNPNFNLTNEKISKLVTHQEKASNPYTLLIILALICTVLCIVYVLNSMPPDEAFLLAADQCEREILKRNASSNMNLLDTPNNNNNNTRHNKNGTINNHSKKNYK